MNQKKAKHIKSGAQRYKFPEKEVEPEKGENSKEELLDDDFIEIPGSLNEELSENIKDNPNKFIGCGG